MQAILNYINTKAELEVSQSRLNLLIGKKEEIYCRFFPTTSKLSDTKLSTSMNKDNMSGYLEAISRVNAITGKSLEDEINEQIKNIDKLRFYLSHMKESINKLKGIEADLYKQIVIEGNGITRAVDYIASKYNKDVSTIWRIYNKNVKMLVKCK